MIIDIHNHADYHSYGVRRMVENMDQNNIDITVLLSWEAPKDDYAPGSKHALSVFSDDPVPFKRCVDYCEAVPNRFLLGFCPDPRRPDAVARLKSAAEQFQPAICGELKLRMMYDNPDAIRLYRTAGALGMPVLVHLDYELGTTGHPWPNWWYGGGIEALERALALCPETNFFGHAPGFWAHISADGKHLTEAYPKGPVVPGGKIMELLDKYPNLNCDISAGSGNNALRRDPEFTKRFLTQYQDRVCYARDYYDSVHQELLNSLGLPKEIMDKIYYKNAIRLINTAARPDLAKLL